MEKLIKTNEEWKKILTEEQYHILREKGTELPGKGKYVHNKKEGNYHCIACDNLLFSSKDKFDSGTGWPSFTQPANKNSIEIVDQYTIKYGHEDEVICKKCEGHHGHVFKDGPTKSQHPKGTGKRFCVNGNVLVFKEDGIKKSKGGKK